MTKREAAIISAYTGILIGQFEDMAEYAESLLNRPIYSHEYADENFVEELRRRSLLDFAALQESIMSDDELLGMIKECLLEAAKYDFARGNIQHRGLGRALISLDQTAQSILDEAKEWESKERQYEEQAGLFKKCQK